MVRENAGFRIIAEVPLTSDVELVIGYKLTSIGESYVCWFCKDKTSYYWGNYSSTYCKAIYSLIERLNNYYPRTSK